MKDIITDAHSGKEHFFIISSTLLTSTFFSLFYFIFVASKFTLLYFFGPVLIRDTFHVTSIQSQLATSSTLFLFRSILFGLSFNDKNARRFLFQAFRNSEVF